MFIPCEAFVILPTMMPFLIVSSENFMKSMIIILLVYLTVNLALLTT